MGIMNKLSLSDDGQNVRRKRLVIGGVVGGALLVVGVVVSVVLLVNQSGPPLNERE